MDDLLGLGLIIGIMVVFVVGSEIVFFIANVISMILTGKKRIER